MPITDQLVGPLPSTALLEPLEFDGVGKIKMLLRADLQAQLFRLNARLPLPMSSRPIISVRGLPQCSTSQTFGPHHAFSLAEFLPCSRHPPDVGDRYADDYFPWDDVSVTDVCLRGGWSQWVMAWPS